MPTPREIIAQNVRRGLANLATDDLEYSTDDGATWLPFAGAAVLHVDTAAEADVDDDLGSEGNQRLALLKVSDQAASQPAETWLIRQSGVPSVAWAVLGAPSIHSGQRHYRLGYRDSGVAGPDRGQLR